MNVRENKMRVQVESRWFSSPLSVYRFGSCFFLGCAWCCQYVQFDFSLKRRWAQFMYIGHSYLIIGFSRAYFSVLLFNEFPVQCFSFSVGRKFLSLSHTHTYDVNVL